MSPADEDRIIRSWTPILLRLVLLASMVTLVGALIDMAARSPEIYVDRFRRIQSGELHAHQDWAQIFSGALQGHTHPILTLGLAILTLVPLLRVAFCFFLFLGEKNKIFVVLTGYVLAGLIFGAFLGRIG